MATDRVCENQEVDLRGFIMLGGHLLMHWSSTQSTVSLSSAEAELNAIIKAFSETSGVKNMM